MIVIIAGMHRSGSSAIAGLLHNNGVLMGSIGEFYPPPMKENKKGFFENKRFRRINDVLLNAHGYHVKSFDPGVPLDIRPSTTSSAMDALIGEYNGLYYYWGWKDPRNALTLGAWFELIEVMGLVSQTRLITMSRNLDVIVESMKRRGNKEKTKGQFHQLAVNYYASIDYHYAHHRERVIIPIPKLNISYDKLLDETSNTVLRLETFLNKEINDLSFLDLDLRRTMES